MAGYAFSCRHFGMSRFVINSSNGIRRLCTVSWYVRVIKWIWHVFKNEQIYVENYCLVEMFSFERRSLVTLCLTRRGRYYCV
jgi:hypothetical protein